MSTTATLHRIEQILESKAYQAKIGKAPRHLSNEISVDEYKAPKTEPKHRKPDSTPKHRRWSIEQS